MAQANILKGQRLFIARLAIGLAQGLALYLLYRAQDGQVRSWPATNGFVFAPLLMCWIFIPLLLASALGEMRWQRAVLWTAIAAAILAILAVCDIWSAWPQDWVFVAKAFIWQAHILPSRQLLFFGGAGLFIAHALVVGGHADGQFRATYPTHFDVAWKLAVQAALAGVFVGAFWLLLFLGAGLFDLIKLDFFQKLIRHEWFSIPATTLATAGALHLTDIRPALVRGARTLLLSLLSWLLPLLTLIVAGFLASLSFTGLTPLWSVGHASALLLAASAVIIVLINAAHQDGEAERTPPKILRAAGTLAAILPIPLSLIAAYALSLRVQQYGWSADRVIVAACVLVATGYAVGYARAAIPRGIWLQHIEAWNFNIAILILAVLLALLTPIASPARIAVADQMARLESGKTAPQKFDFKYLRWQGGRYGQSALVSLTQSQSAFMREAASVTLRQVNQFEPLQMTPESFAARIVVHPKDAKLPQSFLAIDWNKDPVKQDAPACMRDIAFHCEALLTDLAGDGRSDVVIFSENTLGAEIFRDTGNGVWRKQGTIAYPFRCKSVLDALRSGSLTMVPPATRWNDIVVGSLTLHVADISDFGQDKTCPKSAPGAVTLAPSH